ncbi:hypothetical protein GQ42DRAFT_111863, partial [Ramicandelaber brevisporus]
FVTHGKKIVAMAFNYHQPHGNTDEPCFFLKPTTTYTTGPDACVECPDGTTVLHEVELGVVVGCRARNIECTDAFDYIAGYCLALDMTAGDLVKTARKNGIPWTAAKSYDTFTPVSEFIPKDAVSDPDNLELCLTVNGEIKQCGSTKDMVLRVSEIVEMVSKVMTLEPGDVILTGTPLGTGPVYPGNVIEATMSEPARGEIATVKVPVV